MEPLYGFGWIIVGALTTLIVWMLLKRLWDLLPKTIDQRTAQRIRDDMVKFMCGDEWQNTRAQLDSIVNEHLVRITTDRLQPLGLHQSHICSLHVAFWTLSGMYIPQITRFRVDQHIDQITRLLLSLQKESRIQGGGWSSPLEIRQRISTVFHTLNRIA
jgi:hypothetical protein